MSVKSILSAYSGEAAKGSGLRHAIRLAKFHDAHLSGVLRHGRPQLQQRFQGMLPSQVIDALAEADAEHIAEVAKRFTDTVTAAGLAGQSEFIDLDPALGVTLSQLARTFDLVVTGAHSDQPNEAHMSANPDLIALHSGRPVLIVPDAYEAEGLADHALVAWDGKRSAARALGDAMATLEEKSRVTILTVGAHEPKTPPGGGVMTYLKRHGIDADHVHKVRGGKSIARVIEDTSDEVGAKLIVMGAFEHSKFTHDLIGGVTTELIRSSRVPVFMSH